MNRIELLVKKFEDHISLPWQKHLAPPEKTIFVVYPKEDERRLRAKRDLFRQACQKTDHVWHEIDLDDAFARLDELIKELENKAKRKPGAGGS